MVGVYCHTNQLMEIVTAVRTILAPEGLDRLRIALIEQVLSETDIAHRSLSLKNPGRSSFNIPVVHQLLKAGVYLREEIDMKPWILESILNATPPFDPSFADVIRLFAEGVVSSPAFSRISEIEISGYFRRSKLGIEHCHVILMYQMLTLNDYVFKKKTGQSNSDGRNCREYPSFLMESLPLNRILVFLEQPATRDVYAIFYPTIISLMAAHHPQVVTVSTFLHCESLLDEEGLLSLELRRAIFFDSTKSAGKPGKMKNSQDNMLASIESINAALQNCRKDITSAVAC
ncbi:Integrator complex subunit 2 [Entophlyctis luteolus]|nr:Integrator complex subunit 2 [Entophlyctis luteolus]